MIEDGINFQMASEGSQNKVFLLLPNLSMILLDLGLYTET